MLHKNITFWLNQDPALIFFFMSYKQKQQM